MPEIIQLTHDDEPPPENVHSTDHVVNRNSDQRILKKRGYFLSRLLGEGSYAKVFLADFTDPVDASQPSQILACKVINGNEAPKDFIKKFFPREIEIMSRVNHQYLIRVHSILQRKNKYFLFMQYCENGDVLEFIRRHGAIKEKQARNWFSQILRGLHYLHEHDIAHRDMKCENILLTHAYNAKISDFGFARYVSPTDRLSETFCGSVSYAAPEIIRGLAYEPKAADIWSLGVILYVMLNKAMPFDDTSLKLLYENQMSRTWKFRTKLTQVLSKDVKNFVYTVLDPDVLTRKKPEQLWTEEWMQLDSAVSLLISGPPKVPLDPRIMNKRETIQQREKLESDKHEADMLREDAPAVHIFDADTAKLRHASYFFNDSDSASTSNDVPRPKTQEKKRLDKRIESKGVLGGLFEEDKPT